jgi:hypothetical protein
MFSLYMDFRNNPQFQRMGGAGGPSDALLDSGYGGAEVMQVVQGK